MSLLLAAGMILCGCALPRAVTTATLLSEMTDLKSLTEFPDPPFVCRQFSSYDRRSQSPDQGDDWFANHDAGQFLRTERHGARSEYVMMDADGPGAMVRIWSANPKGTLRIYLDGREAPVLEAPMADLLGGRLEGVPQPIAGVHGRGWNCYLPIPYAKHCKVTSDEGGFYYHANYRTYPRGTRLRSFQPKDLVNLAGEISETAQRLASVGLSYPQPSEAGAARYSNEPGMVLTGRGQSASLFSAAGPGAIIGLSVRVQSDDLEQALRKLLLTMEFDGQKTVICPLGDFFGAAPGVCPYASLPLGMEPDGTLWCNWVMPYRDSVEISLRDYGQDRVRVTSAVVNSKYTWTNRSMHFHAQWRPARDVPTRPMHDWNYVSVRGQGVFVGAALAIANPVKTWWGEGDEKIYVDGETFPSHFGTGTEDYYGYAWGCNQPFAHAYHNQPRCDGPDNYGHTAVNRWHILDRIPFRESLRFDMEIWHWWEGVVPEMSVMTYWYARPGATSNRALLTETDLRPPTLPPYQPPRVEGALEGEELRVVQRTAELGPQPIAGCSNEQHLWWRGGSLGDRLLLEFPAPRAGRYRVLARFVKSYDYATVSFRINGQDTGQTIDLYSEQIALTDEIALGEFELREGANYFEAEIVGANPNSRPGYMFGLDYLRLEPLP